MAERLVITKDNGENVTVEFVCAFAIPQMQKQFLITTMNEIDPNGLVILNVSEIQNKKLIRVVSDDDWSRIKQVMRSIISSSVGDFKYLPYFNTINSNIDYARNISVQGVAKDQLVKDYGEKKPVSDENSQGTPLTQPDEPLVDVPMNPALGNTATPVGFGESEVAPGIVEVKNQQPVNPVADFTPVSVTEKPIDLVSNNQPSMNAQPTTQQPMQQPVNMPNNNFNQNIPPMGLPANQPAFNQIPNQQLNNAAQFSQPQYSQPMQNNANSVNNQNIFNINFDQIVTEAKEVFMESARNLAEVIVANAFESIKKKEEELRNREIILAQREAAINQQTMMSMNQMQYNNPQMMNGYNNYGNQQMPNQ